jgi:predicted nucleotidyltransferase
MARSVAEQNLTGDRIPHKAYLYVLRALLAVRWIEHDRGPVPVEFARLLDAAALDPDLREAINGLLAQKRTGTEADQGPRLPSLQDFIEAELERQASLQFPAPKTRPGLEPLHAFFRAVLERFSSRR